MNAILAELGYHQNRWSQLCLFMVFALMTGFFLTLGQLASVLGLNPVVLHAIIWGVWFFWQGQLFAQHRQHYLHADPATAYRKAFRRDILPGVTLGVSQMVHPTWSGFFRAQGLTQPWAIGVGLATFVCGLGLLYAGFRTIGFDGAGFLYEYRESRTTLKQHSIYRFIRHPLFLGGVLASVGISLVLGGTETLIMAAINILILPIYVRLEDVRLISVFGDHYRIYKKQVGGLIPQFRASHMDYTVETEPADRFHTRADGQETL